MMEHSKEWLKLKCDNEEKSVFDFEAADGSKLHFFVHPVRLQYFFGDRAISGLRVHRFVLTCDLKMSVDMAKIFIKNMKSIVNKNKVIYLQGVVEDESLSKIIKVGYVSKYFKVLPRGKPYKRRLINLPDSFEEYLGTLPSKARKDIKKSLRKFYDLYQDSFSVRNYSSLNEIDELFDVLSDVSSKTYQAKHLGLGLSKNSHIYNEFMEGARHGYSNCYVLYINEKPISWRLGYCFENVFYSHHVGYDPDYKGISPGVILHLLSIKALIYSDKKIRIIDLLYGDNEVKKKVSNFDRVESNLYLFPKNIQGYFNYYTMKYFDRSIEIFSSFLDKLKLKEKIKYFMR
jgi:hypothetical protein